MAQLDTTNLQLLDLLQDDARISISDLARRLGRGESTIRDRMVSLERAGILTGYRAQVNANRLGYRVHAVVRARTGGQNSAELAKLLNAVPQVIAARFMTGQYPVRIEVLTKDVEELESLTQQRFASFGLEGMETEIVLQTLVAPRPVPARLQLGQATDAGSSSNGTSTGTNEVVATSGAGPRLAPILPR